MPPFHSRAIFVHLRTGTSSDVDVNPENLLLRITTRKGLVQVSMISYTYFTSTVVPVAHDVLHRFPWNRKRNQGTSVNGSPFPGT